MPGETSGPSPEEMKEETEGKSEIDRIIDAFNAVRDISDEDWEAIKEALKGMKRGQKATKPTTEPNRVIGGARVQKETKLQDIAIVQPDKK